MCDFQCSRQALESNTTGAVVERELARKRFVLTDTGGSDNYVAKEG